MKLLPAIRTASLIWLKIMPEPSLLETVTSQVAVYEPNSSVSPVLVQEVKHRAMLAAMARAKNLMVFIIGLN